MSVSFSVFEQYANDAGACVGMGEGRPFALRASGGGGGAGACVCVFGCNANSTDTA